MSQWPEGHYEREIYFVDVRTRNFRTYLRIHGIDPLSRPAMDEFHRQVFMPTLARLHDPVISL